MKGENILGLPPLVFYVIMCNVVLLGGIWTIMAPAYDPSHSGLDLSQTAVRYGCVIDAGSTGTRLHVYKFERLHHTASEARHGSGSIADNDALAHDSANYRLADELFTEVDVGLATLVSPEATAKDEKDGVTLDQRLATVLSPLITAATKYVPELDQRRTKFTVRATAGFRLLPKDDARRLLHAVRSVIRATRFLYGSVSIISGQEEGVWAWLTVNYLLHRFDDAPNLPNGRQPTVGVMDLGGASTQIVFEPTRGAARTAWVKGIASLPSLNRLFVQILSVVRWDGGCLVCGCEISC